MTEIKAKTVTLKEAVKLIAKQSGKSVNSIAVQIGMGNFSFERSVKNQTVKLRDLAKFIEAAGHDIQLKVGDQVLKIKFKHTKNDSRKKNTLEKAD